MIEDKMRSRVRRHLRALQAASEELGALDDQVRAQLIEIENTFDALRVGVCLSVNVDTDPAGGWEKLLSYSKGPGGWGLYLETGVDGIEDSWQTVRLTESSREDRATALETWVLKLLESAGKKLERSAASRKRALSIGDTVLRELQAAAGGGTE